MQAINKFQIEVGGPLHGGDPGLRLIRPSEGATVAYFDRVPPAFVPREDEWLLVPLYHVFGSEPLSMLTPAVASMAPPPYVAIGRQDAERVGLDEGDEVTLRLDGSSYRLTLQVRARLPAGVAGIPVGLAGLPRVPLPAWGRISAGQGQAGAEELK